jgi:hypothetical protein
MDEPTIQKTVEVIKQFSTAIIYYDAECADTRLPSRSLAKAVSRPTRRFFEDYGPSIGLNRACRAFWRESEPMKDN